MREQHPRLTAGLTAACGDIELAKDIAQDTFLAAYEHWNQVQTYNNPNAWIQKVAKNRLIDNYRRTTWRKSRQHLLTDQASQEPEETDVDIHAAVAHLSTDQRASIVAYYFDDLSVAEIAELCQAPQGTIKWRLSAARDALRASPELGS